MHDNDPFFSAEASVPPTTVAKVPSASPLSHISPRGLLKDLRKNLVWVLLCACFGAVGGLGLAWNITPVYESRTVMIRHVKNTTNNDSLYNEPEIRTILETVKLRENLEALKARLDLAEKPEDLFQQIEVKPGQRSDIIQVLAQAKTPQLAADMAQTMSEIFQSSSAGLSQNVARRVYTFRQAQRKRFEERLHQAQQALNLFQKKHKIAFFEDSTRLLLEQIKQLELDLERAKIQQNRDREAIGSIAQKLKARPENIRVTQTVRYRNRVRYQELESQLQALLKRYTPQNPKVIALQTQMDALAAEDSTGIPEEESYGMDPVVRELKIDQAERSTAMEGHVKTIQQLSLQIKAQRAQLKKLAALESEVKDLQRHIDRENENLRENDYRLSESENDMEARISAFDILEPATPPTSPLPTRKKLLVLAGLFAGTFVGLGGSALRSILSPTLHYPEQMALLGLKPLGTLSSDVSKTLTLGHQVVSTGQQLAAEEPPALLLVSSAKTGDSKAFMAQCDTWFAQQPLKTAIIQSSTQALLPTHDLGHWLYEKNAPLPLPLASQSQQQVQPQSQQDNQEDHYHFAFQKQDRLPLLDKLATLYDHYGIELILWELDSPSEVYDLFIQLSAQAKGVIWVLNAKASPHNALKQWCKATPTLAHKGVWHEKG
jgi:uncharacterized protein involved in exopolysaccharide biosynthesis